MEYKVCRSAWSKARGLMFSRKKNLVFVFDDEKRRNLHMFFVFFPIDVLFLDKDKKIVEIKKNFKPFTYYKPKNKVKYIVEISEGLPSNHKIKEKIEF
ncbi:DUF192 domain-containing protein [Candidatus Woesearchaeota archaeon]|nr:DUF192 domain-containing protein [Candidatus Woesearchaeota archaeon]